MSNIQCNGPKLPHLNLTGLSLQIIRSRMALNFIAKAPGNFLRFSQPRLKTFAKYAKVELTPPSPGELGQVKMENLQISLKQFLIKKYWPYSRKNLRSFSFPTLIYSIPGCEGDSGASGRCSHLQVGPGQHGPGGCQHSGRC